MGGDMILLATMAVTAAVSAIFAFVMTKKMIWQSTDASVVSVTEAEKAAC
ncbi:hypothetical protein [Cloacibacillus sp. An23]|nr:hypothetical protein [Cloacibacillus sp. An23]